MTKAVLNSKKLSPIHLLPEKGERTKIHLNRLQDECSKDAQGRKEKGVNDEIGNL